MKLFFTSILFILASSVSNIVNSQQISQMQFEKEIFSLSEVSRPGISKERFEKLTDVQRRSLVESRKFLHFFFIDLERKDGEINRYLSDAMRKKYPKKNLLINELVDRETSIVGMTIVDFLSDSIGKEIEFDVAVLTESEGSFYVNLVKVNSVKSPDGWRLVQIGKFK